MLTVYSRSHTPRLSYVLRFFLDSEEFRVTDSPEAYLAAERPAICYDKKPLGRGVHIAPCGLLEGHTPHIPRPSVGKDAGGNPVLYPDTLSDMGFDPLGAAFYLLARCEEYASKDLDQHKRYLPESSVLHAMGCLGRPLVDEWGLRLRRLIRAACPGALPRERQGRVVLTHDIDLPFRYRARGPIHSTGALLRDLLARRDPAEALRRLKCMLHLDPDPYFNLEALAQAGKDAGLEPLFFIHCGPCSRHDRKDRMPSRRYARLLREMAQGGCLIGLHPSYETWNDPQKTAAEKKKLEKRIRQEVCASRQHFLRFRIPYTPRALLQCGLTDDYSLGYSTKPGFRAGTARPFPYFDLGFNVGTELVLHPLTAMDLTLRRDLRLSASESAEKMLGLARTALAAGGDCCLLIHNSSLAGDKEWGGWQEMYPHLLHELHRLEQECAASPGNTGGYTK